MFSSGQTAQPIQALLKTTISTEKANINGQTESIMKVTINLFHSDYTSYKFKSVFYRHGIKIHLGNFKKGLMHGKGVYSWPDGKKYDGEFFNDKKHGQGSFEWENGDKYTGQWKDGKMNGEGKIKIGGKTSKGYWEDGIKIKDL